MAFNNNNNNNDNFQGNPFWDWARTFGNQGAGVDHPAQGFWGPQGPPPPGHGPHRGPHGFGGPHEHGPRPGRRGRHGHRHGDRSRTISPEGDRSDHEARKDGEEREGSENPHRGPRHGRCGGGRGGPRHWGHHRGGWGGDHHGRRGPPGPPPFGGAGSGAPFDLSTLIGSLAAHPLAQAFGYGGQGLGDQRSGEMALDVDSESSFVPPIDIFSIETSYVLHVALPGAKKEDVGINWDAEKGSLNIAGVVYRKGDEDFLKTLKTGERKVGAFERTVKLPPAGEDKEEIDSDGITAKLEDGVLVVTVPKVEREWTEVKKVDID